MSKKLTITVSDEVYEGLHRQIGRRRISRFLDQLARPHLINEDLRRAYEEMAADRQREKEAAEWADALIGDTTDETR